MLGSEAIILLQAGTHTLHAKVTADLALERNLRVGGGTQWVLESAQLYFFARHSSHNGDAVDDEITLYSPYQGV